MLIDQVKTKEMKKLCGSLMRASESMIWVSRTLKTLGRGGAPCLQHLSTGKSARFFF